MREIQDRQAEKPAKEDLTVEPRSLGGFKVEYTMGDAPLLRE